MQLKHILRKTMQLTNHGIILMGPDQRIIIWNAWLVKASQVSEAQAVGKTLHELFGDLIAKRLQNGILAALKGSHSSILSSAFTPHPLPLKTGHQMQDPMIQRVTIQNFLGLNEQNYCLIDISDVTNAARREQILKQKSSELSRALGQLTHILSSVSGAVISTNLQDEIETLNPAAEALLGIKIDHAKAKHLGRFIDSLPQVPTDGHFQQVLHTSFGKSEETRRHGYLNFSVNHILGHPIRTWFIQDVTKEKETENKLRQASHIAQEASHHKSQFLANMSHEIRTPMNGILGMAELLLDSNDLSNEQQDFVSTIQRSADGMLHIINDLLDFSKIDSGRLRINAEPFDLRQIIEELCDLIDPQARQKGVDLAYFIPHHIPGDLISDPQRIQQILLNLVANAIKFTDKGEVIVSVYLDPVANHTSRMRIAVRDSGVGIPAASLPDIFEPFSQVDNSTTRRYGGTGLGLAISKQLAHLLDGSIEVESKLGEGSTFSFQIPVRVADRTCIVYPFNTEILAPFLVLTKTPTMRQFLSHQLKQWPHLQVTLIDDPDKALAYLQKVSHFGVIVDFGEETEAWLNQLRAIETLKTLPTLAVIARKNQPANDPNTLVSPHLLKLSEIYGFLTTHINRQALPPRKQVAKALAPLPKTCRILLVEDNIVNQKVARKMLNRLGCEVALAENGEAALELMSASAFDLVFMDCMMPIMDGYTATESIRKQERALGEPHRTIVAMTANAMNYDREKCLSAGMDDYLSKPVHAKEMRAMILKWVSNLHM